MTRSFRVLLVPMAVVAYAAGCDEPRPIVKPPPPVKVAVAHPVMRRLTDREEFTGRTDAIYSVDVKARVSGYLAKVLFVDGAEVKEGQPLFQIDARPYQAEVDRKEAAVSKADAHRKRLEADFKRAANLFDRNVIGREEFDLIGGDFDEAKAMLDNAVEERRLAKLNLEWTTVTARISGLASRRLVDPGALIKAEDAVLTNIVTQDPLYVYFDLDEGTLLRLRRLIKEGTIQSADGKAVSVFIGLADEDDYPQRGTVDFSENKTDPATGTLRLRGTIENPKPYMLNPGMFVNVRLPVGEPHDVILIPERALGTDQGRKFVYVVNERDEVVYRPVKIGFAEQSLRVIQDGLKPGDRVILTGIQRIRPGLKVIPELASQPLAGEPDGGRDPKGS